MVPVVAALESGDWISSCQQKLVEMVATFNQALPVLNKYLTTLPDEFKANEAVIAGFNEAKVSLSSEISFLCSF